ncbi:MAG: tRNA 2-thiouridine(34) synthase MnmA, partial [Actinomycetota bacterium]
MSGGVDSSVATALAVRAGHDVVGATLKQWEFGDEAIRMTKGCNTLDAVADARRAADVIGIPHYTMDFRDTFEREVVEPFVDDYATGLTPNPCVRCNERVRFGVLLDKAEALGFEGLITGHWARADDGRLFRAANTGKDQSYVLYAIGARGVAGAHFPLGGIESKDEVRAIARDLGLLNADREDSLEVCFVGEHRRPGDVVAERVPVAVRSGPIVDRGGNVVGEHRGLAYYTVGQRKGIGAHPDRRYVTEIDPERNVLVIGDADALLSDALDATRTRFIHGPPSDGDVIDAVVRYRGTPARATFTSTRDGFALSFDEGVRAVTPGQHVVLYRGDEVLGGG